jgi:hypothetical protein
LRIDRAEIVVAHDFQRGRVVLCELGDRRQPDALPRKYFVDYGAVDAHEARRSSVCEGKRNSGLEVGTEVGCGGSELGEPGIHIAFGQDAASARCRVTLCRHPGGYLGRDRESRESGSAEGRESFGDRCRIEQLVCEVKKIFYPAVAHGTRPQ